MRKAIIPAAGLGTRMAPFTPFVPKELLPIGLKPAIQYVIEEAADAGITEIGLVLSTKKDNVYHYFTQRIEPDYAIQALAPLYQLQQRVTFHKIKQVEPTGLGDAIACCRTFTNDEPFAVLLPDNFFIEAAPVISRLIEVHKKYKCTCVAVRRILTDKNPVPINEAPMDFEEVEPGVLRIHRIYDKGHLRRSPACGFEVTGIGRIVLTPEIYDCIEAVRPTVTGELEDIQPLQELLTQAPIMGVVIDSARFDVGNWTGYLGALAACLLPK